MPKCPHCKQDIYSLEHGVCATLIFKTKLDGPNFDEGFVDGKPLNPHAFDVVAEWYVCPACMGEELMDSYRH
jgi:hypothetical protein